MTVDITLNGRDLQLDDDRLVRDLAMLRSSSRMAKLGGWLVSVKDQTLIWSDETAAIHGELAGFSPSSMEAALGYHAPEYREPFRRAFAACEKDGTPFEVDLDIITTAGRRVRVRSLGEAVRNASGEITHVTGACQDVSDQKVAATQLQDLDSRLHETLETIANAFFTLDRDWRFTYLNAEAERLLDRPRAALLGRNIWQEFAAAVGTASDREYHRAMNERIATRFDQFYPPLDRWLNAEAHPTREGIAVYFRDVTERHKDAEKHIAQMEGKYRGLLEAAPDAMVVVNQVGEIVLSNLQAEKQFGYGSGELLGRQVTSIIPQGFAERLVADGTRSAAEALVQQIGKGIELSAKRKDGSEFPIEIMLSPLASDEGVLVTAAIRDITVHNRNEAKLLELARLDLLTGLPNRAVFAAAVQKAIAWARNGGPGFAVFYLDLDHFKDVNDTLGHPVGDALLKEVAQRLEANVRETDTVARFGGDEFAILATEIKEPADAGVLAAGLLEIFSEPFSVGGNQIRSGASIGIAIYGVDATGAEMLLSRADVALYRAKEEGRGTYRFFTEAMDADVRTRVALGHDLRDAIGSPQIFLVYQPQVEASTGRIVGVEALARWRHPMRGMISPAEFIPAAETNGLIGALGHWVLWEACRQAGKWREAGIAPGVMAVNLSALQFKTPLELEKDVVAALAASGLPPGMLELEITESLLMAASFANNEVLVRLRASGIRLAIDDFGTGFSSLDYLRQFPMDRIKIAQNFVLDLGTGASTAAGSAAVVKATIGLARELGIDVIAEGVETAEQLRLIKSWRCDEVQGYFFAKPLSPEELVPLLQAGRIVPPAPVELKPAA
jgi:diguanylate cyclase (GGDEF)-like protein/PAS domain S-box-containing protein